MYLRDFVNLLGEEAFEELRKAVEGRSRIEGTELVKAEMEFLQTGQYIEAIKHLRNRTGMGLKEAKDYIDGVRQSLPP